LSKDERKAAARRPETAATTQSDNHNVSSPPLIAARVVHSYGKSCPSKKERMSRIDRELIRAAYENNLPEVRRLLSVGADVNTFDDDDMTPLHWASNRGHIQVIQVLMEHGADIEKKDYGGDTPLHMASEGDHLPVVKALLSGGADILAANNDGRLPVHLAVIWRKSEVSKYLLQHYYATTSRLPLHELLKDLTWIGDPNIRVSVPTLFTALRRGVLGTNEVVEILEFLVDRNPELVSARDQIGALPLHVACRRGASFSIVQSLVNLYKASVKRVTPGGDLPLFLACEIPEPSLDTIFLLMKLYPDLVYR
jgi:ankyrin repeat protein